MANVKRTINSLKAAIRLSHGMMPFLLAAIIIPILVLGAFGVFAVYDYGYLLEFILLLTVCALLVILPLWAGKKSQPETFTVAGEGFVNAAEGWADFDQQVWKKLNHLIIEKLRENAEWGSLQQHVLSLIMRTAEEYHGTGKRRELAFTIPELLIMVEEISRRYRRLLQAHVPFIEQVDVSLIAQGYDNKTKLETGWKSATWFWNTYRVVRFVNPVTAVISELRSQAIGILMTHVNTEIQHKLKRALLQEAVSVAIDLYSGRFKVDDSQLKSSFSSRKDTGKMALPLDPLRVCLIGQVSSGKSSIVNALVKGMIAEVSVLPATDRATVYQCCIEGLDAIHLVDLPGFDGDKKNEKRLLQEVVGSDLILWVLKANQPARALDIKFKALLDGYYANKENRLLKRPPMIGILNQVDRLSPASEGAETQLPAGANAEKIRAALDYNRQLLGFSTLIPLAVGSDKEAYNMAELTSLLDKNYSDGVQTQLNRRRNESAGRFILSDQAKRVFQSGRSLFSLLTREEKQ